LHITKVEGVLRAVSESIMKISVIIPAYNAEPYIAKAIESCLSQT